MHIGLRCGVKLQHAKCRSTTIKPGRNVGGLSAMRQHLVDEHTWSDLDQH